MNHDPMKYRGVALFSTGGAGRYLDARVSLLALGVVGGVGVGAVAARAKEAKQVVDEETSEESEDEEAKGNSSSGGAAADGHSHGDGTSEPEDGGDAFEDEGDQSVEAASEEKRDDGNVEKDEN